MKVQISKGHLRDCEISVISSKSISHRYLIAAALSNGTSVIQNLAVNNDILATINCLKLLGADITLNDTTATVRGITDFNEYNGTLIECGESGSTLRFLIPLFSLTGKTAHFTGKGRLLKRPMSVYEPLFEEFTNDSNILIVKGSLKPGKYILPGEVSSQFITGLMFALPLLNEDSEITVAEPFNSKSYADMTVKCLKQFGITITSNGSTYYIKGNQKYQPSNVTVESDDSQAAFFGVLAALNNITVSLTGICSNSMQGDHVFTRILTAAGAEVTETETSCLIKGNTLKPLNVSLADCPDLGPILFALASQIPGTSLFTDTRRLKDKESDRIMTMKEELEKAGSVVREENNTVTITGPFVNTNDIIWDSHNDHRVAMALSILAASQNMPVTITNAEAVNKSYPDFYKDLSTTGAEVIIYD